MFLWTNSSSTEKNSSKVWFYHNLWWFSHIDGCPAYSEMMLAPLHYCGSTSASLTTTTLPVWTILNVPYKQWGVLLFLHQQRFGNEHLCAKHPYDDWRVYAAEQLSCSYFCSKNSILLFSSLTIHQLLDPVSSFSHWDTCWDLSQLFASGQAVNVRKLLIFPSYMGHAHPSTMESLQGGKKKTIHGSMTIDRNEYRYINTILYYIILYYTILYYIIIILFILWSTQSFEHQ